MATGAGFEHASERMKENLAKALEKPTSLAYAVSAEIQVREGRYEEAFAAIDKATSLAPSDPENYIAKAEILNATGRVARGRTGGVHGHSWRQESIVADWTVQGSSRESRRQGR